MHGNNASRKGASHDLVTSFDADGILVREAEWGALNVGFQRFPKGFDLSPYLRGLPNDECQCPHWGYVTKGRLVIAARGKPDLVVGPGETYYMAPGHTIRFDAETELIEWSPAEDLAKTMKVIEANFAKESPR